MRKPVTERGAYERQLWEIIESATLSVSLFALSPLPVAALRQLLLRLEAGVAVDVIVPSNYLHKVGLTERYRQRLAEAGGRFFLVTLAPADWRRVRLSPHSLLLLDEQQHWQPTDWQPLWRIGESNSATLQTQFDQLRALGTIPAAVRLPTAEGTGWRRPDHDLVVTFRAEATLIQAGEQARLHWSVPGATTVDIQPGIGAVPPFGSRTLSLRTPTEFTLTARRGATCVAKVLKVAIDRRLLLSYALMANDPLGLRSPSRLTDRPDLPGFFGVLQDVPLTLHWQTTNAQAVAMNDKTVETAGEYTFTPQARTELRLQAVGLQGEERDILLTIQPFAVPRAVPAEVLTPPAAALPTVAQPVFSAANTPPPLVAAAEDPLAQVAEATQRKLRAAWRAKHKRGVMEGVLGWFKKWSE